MRLFHWLPLTVIIFLLTLCTFIPLFSISLYYYYYSPALFVHVLTLGLIPTIIGLTLVLRYLIKQYFKYSVKQLHHACEVLLQDQWQPLSLFSQPVETKTLFQIFNQVVEHWQTKLLALEKNENQLKLFLESMLVGIVTIDKEGKVYYLNQKAQDILGKNVVKESTLDEIVKNHQTFLAGTKQPYPEEKQPILRAFQGESCTVDDIEIHQAGKNTPFEVWGTPIFDQQGDFAYAITAFRDITDRKRTEMERIEFAYDLFHLNKKLRESEQKLVQFLEAMPIGIQALNGDGYPYYLNKKAKELLGKKDFQEFIDGKNDYDKLMETYPLYVQGTNQPYPRDWQPIVRALWGESTMVDNLEIRHEKIIPLESWGSPIFDAQGNIAYAIATFQDITERKRADEERIEFAYDLYLLNKKLKEGENSLSQFIDAMPLGVSVLDAQGKPYYFNQKAQELLGSGIMLANTTHELPELYQLYISGTNDLYPYESRPITRALKGEVSSVDDMEVHQGDRVTPIESWGSPIFDEKGNIAYAIVAFQDITERKHAEAERLEFAQQLLEINKHLENHAQLLEQQVEKRTATLQQREQTLQAILDATTDTILMMEIDGKIVTVNPTGAQQFGKTAKQVIGDYLFDLLPHDLATRRRTIADQVVSFKKPLVFVDQKDGIWYEGNYYPVINDDSEVTHVAIFSRDITQRKQAEEALEKANKAKSTFLANMSHELRTPLNGILGYAQILQADATLGENQQKGINIIRQCGEHLLTLINDILDISKIEAGKLELAPSICHLPEFIHTIVELFRMRAQQNHINFVYQASDHLPPEVSVDEKRLRQILLNLLSNAVKFTQKGDVTLSIKVESVLNPQELKEHHIDDGHKETFKKFTFGVKDTGIGISEEEIEQIFLPFQQVGSQSLTVEGTGLGLPISKKLVGMMGGKLQVKSVINQGSCFYFSIMVPVKVDVEEEKLAAQQAAIIGYKGQPHTILIVDDKWQNRSMLISLLQPLNFEIIEAENGQEALDKAYSLKPKIILMDIVMPVMDGIESSQHIRQFLNANDSVIIGISADIVGDHQQQCYDAGCQAFLPKPVDTQQLLETLEKYCEIEWICDSSVSGAAVAPNVLSKKTASADVKLVPPSSEQAVELLDLAKAGDIHGIVVYAQSLEEDEPELKGFVQEVCQLARSFQERKLQQFIKQFIDKAS